jgi:colicin import membrane protein
LQLGIVISVLLHLAILGGTLISLHSRQQLRVAEPEPVAVGMISPGEVTKVRKGVETAKLLEAEAKESPKGEVAKKEAPRAKVAAAAAPPPPPPPPPPPEQKPDPVPAKAAEPPPVPKAAEPPPPPAAPPSVVPAEAALKAEEQRKADEQKQADDQARAEEQKRVEEQKRAEQQKKAEDQKRLEEERRQAELKKKREEDKKKREAALKKKREEEKKRQEAEAAKQKQFNADKIAALLNKVPDSAAPPPSSTPSEQPTRAKGPTLGSAEGRDKQLSASEYAVLDGIVAMRLRQCWALPSGGGGSDTPTVTLRWRLNPDGSLDGEPQVIGQARGDTLFQLAAEKAIRAVKECSPFPLPADKYGSWKTIERNFDPSSMLR